MGVLYCWYGDDFTGSTDVLEQLALGDVPAVLFLGVPTAKELARYPDVQAIGVAGDARSREPAWMSAELPAVFAALKALGAEVAHYKVCSTFDSSAARGSIGRAIEVGLAMFGGRYVPVVVGAPHLRRYVAFGQLFAAGADGRVVRIDRGPMAKHPVTPMLEADLRRHLAEQTQLKIGVVDLTEIAPAAVEREVAAGARAVVFDGVDHASVAAVGELVWAARPVFAVGSSGLTAGLLAAWGTVGKVRTAGPCEGPLLVVSGSCAVMTGRQIAWGLQHGFRGVRVCPGRVAEALEEVVRLLASGRDTVVYSAMGEVAGEAAGAGLGVELGALVREVRRRHLVRRIIFCGGDTASHAVQQLEIRALTFGGALAVGAPLCVAEDGLELVLKGGQVGGEDFFRLARDGVASGTGLR